MAMLDDVDDDDLLSAIAHQDRRAMEALYTRHFSGLTGFVRGYLKDPAAAADVVQETMMAVWRRAGAFEGKSSVRTWIFAIARFKAIDRMRAGGRLVTGTEIPETADEAPDPEAAAIAASEARRLRACLAALDPRRRAVIRLAFYEDMTYEEISTVEGIAVGTVKSRIHHAKQALLRCLARGAAPLRGG